MARVQHTSTATLAQPDGTLKALESIQVYVLNVGSTVTAQIYESRSGGSPISNPFVTDATGRIAFFAESGEYDVRLLDTQVPPRIADQTITISLFDPVVETGDLAAEAVTLAKLDPAVLQALVPAGSIVATARSTAPAGWLMADGAAVSRATYAALFAAIGTTYGAGDGSTTFGLPDLRGRVPVGVDGAANRLDASDTLGASGGAQKHTLTVPEMPSHNHNFEATIPAGVVVANGSYYSPENSSNMNDGVTTSTGGGGAHNNMQPFQIVNYLVKT